MSGSSSHLNDAQDAKYEQKVLPRLHEVLGDMLEYPPPNPTRSRGGYGGSSFTSSSFASSSSRQSTATSTARLPPIQTAISPKAEHHSPPSSHLHSTRSEFSEYPARVGTGLARHEIARQSQGSSSHSYDVFQLTSHQELAHKRSSMKDDHYDVTKEIAISGSSGRFLCSECGRRFQKKSTLKNHLTTHSGERPYECPDCHKSFSVSSNMKRHVERVHKSGEMPGK